MVKLSPDRKDGAIRVWAVALGKGINTKSKTDKTSGVIVIRMMKLIILDSNIPYLHLL
jgi:hypothetical protein